MPRHRNAGKRRTLPDQIEFIIGFLCDAKAESIANRFELSRITLHLSSKGGIGVGER